MRASYLNDLRVTYDIVSVDPKYGVIDIVDGEFDSVASCDQIIEVYKKERDYYFEDGCYLAIRKITRELI